MESARSGPACSGLESAAAGRDRPFGRAARNWSRLRAILASKRDRNQFLRPEQGSEGRSPKVHIAQKGEVLGAVRAIGRVSVRYSRRSATGNNFCAQNRVRGGGRVAEAKVRIIRSLPARPATATPPLAKRIKPSSARSCRTCARSRSARTPLPPSRMGKSSRQRPGASRPRGAAGRGF